MAPRVEVRALRGPEGKRLLSLVRQAKDAIASRRAEIILAAVQGDSPPEIAERLFFTPDYVRKVIHAFNGHGVDSLRAQYTNGGAPKKILPEHESNLIELALTPPPLTGQPFNAWTLETLREVAIGRRLVPEMCVEMVRRILKKHRVSFQRTKTWKESKDPDFEVKKTPHAGSTTRPKRAGKR
jgi:transposase